MDAKAFANFIIRFEIGCTQQNKLERLAAKRQNMNALEFHKQVMSNVWETLNAF